MLENCFGICSVERKDTVVSKVPDGGFDIKAVGSARNNERAAI